MEVKKIAENGVLSDSLLIQKQLNSKLPGSLQYRITDCLERNISLRRVHAEYEYLYGALKHVLELASKYLALWEYEVGEMKYIQLLLTFYNKHKKKLML